MLDPQILQKTVSEDTGLPQWGQKSVELSFIWGLLCYHRVVKQDSSQGKKGLNQGVSHVNHDPAERSERTAYGASYLGYDAFNDEYDQ